MFFLNMILFNNKEFNISSNHRRSPVKQQKMNPVWLVSVLQTNSIVCDYHHQVV